MKLRRPGMVAAYSTSFILIPTGGFDLRVLGREGKQRELRAQPAVEWVHPVDCRTVVGGQRTPAEIDWADHDEGVLPVGVGRQDEEILGRLVADRQAANRIRTAVDHDVAAEGLALATVLRRMNEIERVRIAERERQMRDAVRVQVHDAVHTFRHLAIAFAQFGTDLAARTENGKGANEG